MEKESKEIPISLQKRILKKKKSKLKEESVKVMTYNLLADSLLMHTNKEEDI
jgi:mRNA deadenylase 3'-5' endonuclease subunit Ccr4